MGKYEDLVSSIITNVGGADNIAAVTHCATRLRLKLKDESLADDKAIEDTKGVITLRKTMGQYQIVIGQQVGDVYDEFVATPGMAALAQGSVDDPDAAAEDKGGEKLSIGGKILDILTGALGPLLSVICACGLLKGLCSALTLSGLMASTDTLYQLFNAAGDCVYYFMPILIAYTLGQKLKMNPVVSMTLGLVMVYPNVQNMEDAILFGIDISGISYTQTMFPIIFVMLIAAPIDRWLKKVLPDAISSFTEPALLLLIMTPLSFAIIGPIANLLANGLAAGINAIDSFSPILCDAVLAGIWQILVLFGIHMGVASIIIPAMIMTGSSTMYAAVNIPFVTQFAIAIAMYLRTKDAKVKEIALPAAISAFFGTTEPAIYGLSLPNFKYFVMSCIVSAIGGLYLGFTHVTAYQLSGAGFLYLPSVLSPNGLGDLINNCIGLAIALVLSFVFTFVTYRDKQKTEEAAA